MPGCPEHYLLSSLLARQFIFRLTTRNCWRWWLRTSTRRCPERLANQVCFLCGVRGSECSGSAVGFGIPRIISLMPPELINLPKKQYWLAPEHLAETHAFLNSYFAWFGCAVFLIMILTFDYAIQSNLHPDNRPDISRMWCILAGFVLFTLVWTIRMLLRFGRVPPRDNSKRASARVALHCLLLFAAPYRQDRPEQFARAHGQIHGPGNRRKASNAQDRVVASHLTTALILPKKWKTCWQRNTKGKDSLPGGRRSRPCGTWEPVEEAARRA